MRVSHASIGLAGLLLAGACGGGEKKAAESAPAAAATLPTTVTPCATCKVIEVTMTSNDKGNFFTPAEIEAHVGDVLRYKLIVGVHNVNFLPDSNPGKTGLPPASALLQLPGQTQDIELRFGKGTFFFQCDPHAALGMKGHVKVE